MMIMKGLIPSVITLVLLSAICISCQASPKDDTRNYLLSQKEDGYGKVMKDSIADIIMDAKMVTCRLESKNPADSLRQDTVKTLPQGMKTILQYLFFNNENFKGDAAVYGKFIPWVSFTLEAKKKRTVYLVLDFGLSKWKLLDKDKKQICAQDMKVNNGQLLHFVRLLFPKDKTLKLLNDNLKAKHNEKNSVPIQLPADNSNH